MARKQKHLGPIYQFSRVRVTDMDRVNEHMRSWSQSGWICVSHSAIAAPGPENEYLVNFIWEAPSRKRGGGGASFFVGGAIPLE